MQRDHERLLAERRHEPHPAASAREPGRPALAARRSALTIETNKNGASQGRRRTFATIPRAVVGEAEVAVGAGSYDLDRVAPLRQPLDRIRDEATGEIVRMARVRGREDCDPQARGRRLALLRRTPRRPLGRSCPSRNALCDRHPAPLLKDVQDQSAPREAVLDGFRSLTRGTSRPYAGVLALRERIRRRSAAMARRRSSRATSRS